MLLAKLSTIRFGNLLKNVKNAKRTYHSTCTDPSAYIPNKKPVICSAAEAMDNAINSGMNVFASGAASTPMELLDALAETAVRKKLKNIKLLHIHLEGDQKFALPENKDTFRSISYFMGGNVRKAVEDGRADNVSIFLHDIPYVFRRNVIVPDVALIHVSAIDRHGYSSLGTSVDCVREACRYAKCIIALVNPQMPRTFSDAVIHSSHFDYAVEIDRPLPEEHHRPMTEKEAQIGKLIAQNLIEDGSTLQLGIGAIPNAVLAQCTNHKNLGVHSELFSDGVVDLIYKGCVTNSEKTIHTGRTVGSFLNGTKKLYNFVHDNPSVEMLRVDYVNDTKIIRQMPKMTAINSCLEIDITGQVCSDSIGPRMYSGFGGQVDFIRGASECFDGKGKPIIAMPSITNKNVSKIVNTLKPGAGVVTSRAHVQYIVTEHGIAYLFGKTMLQRAHALISIAHPDHREKLEKEAFERFKCMPAP